MKISRLFRAALVCLPALAGAQTPPPGHQTPPPPPGPLLHRDAPRAMSVDQSVVQAFERTLFPPELVMQHQRELALTPEQRRGITDAVKELQNQTVEMQWNLQAEQTTLGEMLAQKPIPEREATAQLNKLLELEASVKRAHLAALMRIKNLLSDQQVQRLNELRRHPSGAR